MIDQAALQELAGFQTTQKSARVLSVYLNVNSHPDDRRISACAAAPARVRSRARPHLMTAPESKLMSTRNMTAAAADWPSLVRLTRVCGTLFH